MPAVTSSGDVLKALIGLWGEVGMPLFVRSFRTNQADTIPTLYNAKVGPRPEFPYVVFEHMPGMRRGRHMSYGRDTARQTRELGVSFRTHAKSDATAETIHKKILECFDNSYLCLTEAGGVGGTSLLVYENDYGMPENEAGDEFLWVTEFSVRYDAVVSNVGNL